MCVHGLVEGGVGLVEGPFIKKGGSVGGGGGGDCLWSYLCGYVL